MKRFSSLMHRSKSQSPADQHRAHSLPTDAAPNSPEAIVSNAIRLFCESGGGGQSGDEIAQLPAIVEAAESSPAAAARAAHQIRTYLGRTWQSQPYLQYNAIMLIRILSDHPGATFTRNFDKAFVGTIKELLRTGKEPNTQQMLRETLNTLERDKGYDADLQLLLQMWRKEKSGTSFGSGFMMGRASPQNVQQAPPVQFQQSAFQQQQFLGVQSPSQDGGRLSSQSQRSASRTREQLPSPVELAGRIEEARNTAKILLQLIQSTATEEMLQHELVREFSERCQMAQRSMQTYINCNNPPPDDDTMQTLIETNEQLSLAISRHQRALLAARRALGSTPSPNPETRPPNGPVVPAPAPVAEPESPVAYSAFQAPPQPPIQPPTTRINGYEAHGNGILNAASLYHQRDAHVDRPPVDQQPSNPFIDPLEHEANPAPLAFEPTNYGSTANRQSYVPSPPPARAYEPPQSFSIISPDSPPLPQQIISPVSVQDLPYGRPRPPIPQSGRPQTPTYEVSPVLSRADRVGNMSPPTNPISPADVSPASPPRPALDAWHRSEITRSFMQRQRSAADGLTMHGAGSADAETPAVELDSHSQVGRRDRDYPRPAAAPISVSPIPQTPPSSPPRSQQQRDSHHHRHLPSLHLHSHPHSRGSSMDAAAAAGADEPPVAHDTGFVHSPTRNYVDEEDDDEDGVYGTSRPSSQRYSRVDVAGTGGLRTPTSPARSGLSGVFRH